MWLWEPRAFCPFSQKPIQLCTFVTKHWHTLTRPLHKFYSHLRPHWLFGLGGDLCREIRIWWAGKDWRLHNMERLLFLPLDPCFCRLFYPCTWMQHKRQLVFYHRWQSRGKRSLGKQILNYSQLENLTLNDRWWPDKWWRQRYSVHLVRMIDQKKFEFWSQRFQFAAHSPAST